MSEKKGPSCPNWGEGGGFRYFGQCPKEKGFFLIEAFPKCMLCTECLFKVEADAVAKLQAANKGTDDIFEISHLSI